MNRIQQYIKRLLAPIVREILSERIEEEHKRFAEALKESLAESTYVDSDAKAMEKDYMSLMREHLRAFHAAEEDLIATRPTLRESDEENYSDSYKWLRLPIPGDVPESEARMILSDIELFPNDCLAGILAAGCKSRAPKGVHPDSISIDRIGTRFRFCIAGSTTLEELRILCERHRASHDLQDEK